MPSSIYVGDSGFDKVVSGVHSVDELQYNGSGKRGLGGVGTWLAH